MKAAFKKDNMCKTLYKALFALLCFLTAPVCGAEQPQEVTDYVARLKPLEEFLILVSFIACVLIIAGFVWFAFRYKRKDPKEQGQAKAHHNLFLELTWSLIPLVIFILVFAWGWILYRDLRQAPKDSLEIHVYGQMWSWEFIYKNGRKTNNELYVPLGRPVKLILSSRDVIHSFFIPAFKIKQDAVPGVYNFLWFKANRLGKFQVFCAELCGAGHSAMGAKLNVMPLEEWEEWLKNDPYKGLSLEEIGKKAFQGRCTACHKVNSEKMIGPGLAGLFGSTRLLADGSSVTAEENYIRESILNPGAKILQGYGNQMTPFAGLLSEEELSGLIEYIKSLK